MVACAPDVVLPVRTCARAQVLRPFLGPFMGEEACASLATSLVLSCQAAMQASHRVKQ